MNIMIVDDEHRALRTLREAVEAVAPKAEVSGFLTAGEALAHAQNTRVDVAFLDIIMGGLDGLTLAKRLKDIYGDTNIIFVTSHSEYAANAFGVRASGYVMKPIDPARVRLELDNLRNPVHLADQGVRVQCFGNFEVFVDGRPVVFNRPKAKELLAYLVDRKGAWVTKRDLAAVLWEDQPYTRSLQSHLYKLVEEVGRALGEAGAEDVVIKKHGIYSVEPARFFCDYYEWEKCNPQVVNTYRGEYMTNYSWAEFTTGALTGRT